MTVSPNQKLLLRQAELELADGATSNDYHCPKCGRNKSFSVTKKGGLILFHCHRSSCDCSGVYGIGGFSPSSKLGKVFTPKLFTYQTVGLDEHWYSTLLGTFSLQRHTIDWAAWRFCPETCRIVMPVLSPFQGVRGYVARSFVRGVEPKSITYKEMDNVFLGWYTSEQTRSSDYVTVVEDLTSALRVFQGGKNAVALMGTHLSTEMVQEIFSHVKLGVLCLDKDATKKSFDYASRYSLLGNFCVVPLSKDIKDMSIEEEKEWNANIQSAVQNKTKK